MRNRLYIQFTGVTVNGSMKLRSEFEDCVDTHVTSSTELFLSLDQTLDTFLVLAEFSFQNTTTLYFRTETSAELDQCVLRLCISAYVLLG